MDITEKLINLSTKIALSKNRSEILNIAAELNVIASQTIQPDDKNETTSDHLLFSKKEIAKMSKTFRKEFIANGCVARIIKRPSGKNTFCFEIRYRRNGYNLSASSTNLERAKDKFYEMTYNIEKLTNKSVLFSDIAEEWFVTRKSKVNPNHYKNIYSYYVRYILPRIGNQNIKNIRTAELNEVVAQVSDKGRAYEDVRSILNQVFQYALYNGIIPHNPVKLVEFIRADREHGQALSFEDEKAFIAALQSPRYENVRQSLLAMLFFGLRPCELESAKFEGDFLITRNRKRKGNKIEYKKIPISPMARKHMDFNISPIPNCSSKTMAKWFAKAISGYKPYDLRHTFSSRCQMFVRQDIVEIWLGDSAERIIGNTYTHFPDSFMIAEMNKVIY